MENVQDGTVHLGLDADIIAGEDTAVRWSGYWESGDRSKIETGPDFLDANDAVAWWRDRGAKRIYIRLDFREYLWAGEGDSPDDLSALSVFDPADARGRPDGAARTVAAERRAFAKAHDAERATAALDEGLRLTRRREAIHLSIDDLADRVGQSTQWLLDVESGRSTYDVTLSQWVDLVWATRQGWPDEVGTSESESVGWVAQRGQFLREAEVIVNKVLGLYD
jgi:transcriptional regulator with XRE-family HTH domain